MAGQVACMKDAKTAKSYRVTGKYDGRSADARRTERRQLLLETAIRLIGRQGYATVSLNAICGNAGLTKRYFYESFDGVEALLTEAFRQISTELQQHVIRQITGQKTPADMISAGLRAFFEYIQAHPERGRVYLVEALAVTSLRADLLGRGGGDLSPFLLATTQQFIATDTVSKSVLTVMAQGTIGAAIFVGQNWIASNYQQPIDELVQGVSEICLGIAQRLNIPLQAGAQ